MPPEQKSSRPLAPIKWSEPVLRHLIDMQKQYGSNPTEPQKIVVMDSLAQMDPNIAPVKWRLVESELSHLRIGPQEKLWTEDMKETLVTSKCRNRSPRSIELIYTELFEEYRREMSWEEAYRMFQQLKLERKIAYDCQKGEWYRPEASTAYS